VVVGECFMCTNVAGAQDVSVRSSEGAKPFSRAVPAGCGCKGLQAWVHVACKVADAELHCDDRGAGVWTECHACSHRYKGPMQQALVERWWQSVQRRARSSQRFSAILHTNFPCFFLLNPASCRCVLSRRLRSSFFCMLPDLPFVNRRVDCAPSGRLRQIPLSWAASLELC
jgi:hypothetical protein